MELDFVAVLLRITFDHKYVINTFTTLYKYNNSQLLMSSVLDVQVQFDPYICDNDYQRRGKFKVQSWYSAVATPSHEVDPEGVIIFSQRAVIVIEWNVHLQNLTWLFKM